MEQKKVLEQLCYFDTRNPIGYGEGYTKEELAAEGFGEYPKKGCQCDNFFYGRSELAANILEFLEKAKNIQFESPALIVFSEEGTGHLFRLDY